MTETNSQAQWFSDNEQNWDDRAELHMAGNYCDYQRLLEDPTAISAELAQDIERFGDLTGKEVIHLQCHVGTDTIGFARRGASRVIGLDLSEASLAHARSIAQRAGADVEFVHANVYDARQAVSGTCAFGDAARVSKRGLGQIEANDARGPAARKPDRVGSDVAL